MFNKGVQVGRDAKKSPLNDFFIDVVKKYGESLLSKDLGKPVPHNPCPNDGDLLDLTHLHILLLKGMECWSDGILGKRNEGMLEEEDINRYTHYSSIPLFHYSLFPFSS